MATWQFDFHLVPATAVEQRFRTVPLAMSEEDYESVDWWEGFEQRATLEEDLTRLLPRTRSWSPNLGRWGDDDADRFDVLVDRHQIVSLFGRIDVRRLSLPFVSDVVELARKWRLLFVTEARRVLQPSADELIAEIRRSPSFAFVASPEDFLNRLSKQREG